MIDIEDIEGVGSNFFFEAKDVQDNLPCEMQISSAACKHSMTMASLQRLRDGPG